MSSAQPRRRGVVYNHGVRAGTLVEFADGSFEFTYDEAYLASAGRTASSLLLLYREPCMDQDQFEEIYHSLIDRGFDIKRLQATLQSRSNSSGQVRDRHGPGMTPTGVGRRVTPCHIDLHFGRSSSGTRSY